MSLINQMLKDLEQRGGWPSDTKFEPAKSESLGTKHEKTSQFTFLKISGILVLLYCAVYLWVKNPQFIQHNNIPPAQTTQAVVANQAAPANANQQIDIAPNAGQANVPSPAASTTPQVIANAADNTTTAVTSTAPSDPIAINATKNDAPKKSAPQQQSHEKAHESADNKLTPQESKVAYAEPSFTENKKIKPLTSNQVSASNTSITKQVRPEQKSANLYRQALANVQQGRVSEAQANLAQALEEYPANQEARQTLAALLLDNKRIDEARSLLSTGLAIAPDQVDFRMAVARLQIEAGDKQGALNTLLQGLSYGTKNADYQAFVATMLQRADRHEEAVDHYNAALNLNAYTPNILIGLGISLQALGRFEEAQAAFTRAQSDTTLNADLTAFVEQRLKQVNQHLRTE